MNQAVKLFLLCFLIKPVSAWAVTFEELRGSINNLSVIPTEAMSLRLTAQCPIEPVREENVSCSPIVRETSMDWDGAFHFPAFEITLDSAQKWQWTLQLFVRHDHPGFPFGENGESLTDQIQFQSNDLLEIRTLLAQLTWVPWERQDFNFISMNQKPIEEWTKYTGGLQLIDMILDFSPTNNVFARAEKNKETWRKKIRRQAERFRGMGGLPRRHFLFPGHLDFDHPTQAFLLIEYFEGWDQFPVRIVKSETTTIEKGLGLGLTQITLRDENIFSLEPLWKDFGQFRGQISPRPGFVDFPSNLVHRFVELDFVCEEGRLRGEFRQKKSATTTEIFFSSPIEGTCLEGRFEVSFSLRSDVDFTDGVQTQFEGFKPIQRAPGRWSRKPWTENIVAENDSARLQGADRTISLPVVFSFDKVFFATLDLEEQLQSTQQK